MSAQEGERQLNVVTGALGYSGKYIAMRLLASGQRVRTLTSRHATGPLADKMEIAPLDFSRPDELTDSMRGASVLYNTYWVRFERGAVTHETAVRNTAILLKAAERAGVRRVVHISITNPSVHSPLPYFRGKAELEAMIRQSSMSHAIVRPAVIFGHEDILINNIAWFLRTFPVFAIPGSGAYRLQPIFVEDLAELAVAAGAKQENFAIDAVGPEIYSYEDLVRLIAGEVGSGSALVHVTPGMANLASKIVGRLVNDVVLTRDEISGLMADLLVSKAPPTARTSLRLWLHANRNKVGTTYASEIGRHYAPASRAAS